MCHSIWAEKQRTQQTNYSPLSLSASLDTQGTLQVGIIVERNKFWQEIPVLHSKGKAHIVPFHRINSLYSFFEEI